MKQKENQHSQIFIQAFSPSFKLITSQPCSFIPDKAWIMSWKMLGYKKYQHIPMP